ncbi:MAG: HAD-IA family hydrolase [Clostridiales bacterium]|nr:HAD-IA family hydrolase [Clostridiales bacterium]
MIKCALFDLDGTLVNTIDDLAFAVDKVLEQYGREKKWSLDDYKSFVGNGAKKLLERAFENTLDENQAEKTYELFKQEYNKVLVDHAFLYDGIKESLDELKQKQIKLAVITNKPHSSAVLMVETLFGKDYFDIITGSAGKPDPTKVNEALTLLGCKASEAIFFGDSDTDILTAKNANVEAVGCSWGFRSFECLFSASPSVIIDKASYIPKLF